MELLRRCLGVSCQGVTAPYSHYRGLAGRPDILAIIARHGIPGPSAPAAATAGTTFRSVGTRKPFWYDRQGFPELLETPMQGWIDAQWRREHGWANWAAYHGYLKEQVDRVADAGLCWSHCQHDWTSVLYDEPLDWTRKFLQYAAERLQLMTHGDFYQHMRQPGSRAAARDLDCGAATDARPH